jgi:predicted heme/steroid binding protein
MKGYPFKIMRTIKSVILLLAFGFFINGSASALNSIPNNASEFPDGDSTHLKKPANHINWTDRERFNYGDLYFGMLFPLGVMPHDPAITNTYEDMYTGKAGLGATHGYLIGVEGFLGFNALNKKLPPAINFGFTMDIGAGFQPYSLAGYHSSANYTYNKFIRVSGGIGPAFILIPGRVDYDFSLYYKIEAGSIFGGSFNYTESDLTDKMERQSPTFVPVQAYGLNMHFKSVIVGVECISYTDKGKFSYVQQTADSNGILTTKKNSFTANLPIKQVAIKVGISF